MRSVMTHNFSQVPQADIPRSTFNRSCGYKTTFDAGYLIPVFFDEALPGDTFNVRANYFARLATPEFPFMDNMFLDSFFFFVPNRLIWENWEEFNGQQENPGDSTDFLIPQIESPAVTGFSAGSVYDYFGIPTEVPGLKISALWLRAMNLIWNEWFRDQNLQDSVPVPKGDGPDVYGDYVLLRRGKRHDYFTSALPWPQKGPSVEVPLGSTAPIFGVDRDTKIGTPASGFDDRTMVADTGGYMMYSGGALSGNVRFSNNPLDIGLEADLSSATASTINALRQAFQIQKLYERDARGGTRYTEIIRAHFGVVSPDARLQRPEYLGGGSTPINIHPIAQNSASTEESPQGNLAAMGVVSGKGGGFTKSFTEHGVIIGLVSARADLNYQQGLERMWSRRTRWDFYWPALSHIGEQAVLNKEIYAVGSATPGQDDAVFGYQERYAEYRYKPSLITGQFRSNFAQSLDQWHLAQDFGSLPTLNNTFIQENPPVDRVIAVPSAPHFLFDAFFDIKSARPMPTYSVPGLIDHF